MGAFDRIQKLVSNPFARFSRDRRVMRRLRLRGSAEAGHPRGLLLVQIDGLSRRELERALAAGRMPFVGRLAAREEHRLHTFYSGIPSSTPAVQAELYYGVRAAVPAFGFLDRSRGGFEVMMAPGPAGRVEAELAARAPGLLEGGSSWSNIYTGGAGAAESHFCAASMGLGDMWRTGRIRTLFTFVFVHTLTSLRLAGLLLLEAALGVWDACHGSFAQGRSGWRETKFLLARIFVCIGLREMVALGAAVDVARGLPIVHVNFLGYDEQSHRRGPGSRFAHWSLRGIDRAVRRLHRAAVRSERRHYDVWIFSDHGQCRSRQFAKLHEGGLEGLVRRSLEGLDPGICAGPLRSQERPSPVRTLRRRPGSRAEARDRAESMLGEGERVTVAAMGPVGHIYLDRLLPTERRLLASRLVAEGVPGVLLRREDGKADWFTDGGVHTLPDQVERFPHAPGLREEVARDLVALTAHPNAGDLVALGFSPDGERWSFASENGAHAGPSPEEVEGFALLPGWVRPPAGEGAFLRPAGLRALAMELLGRDPESGPAKPRVQGVRDPARPLRVATYNAHGCVGTDGILSPARIATALDSLDADVVAVQELDAGRARSLGMDQPGFLARSLGLHVFFSASIDGPDGAYGHAILSREPLLAPRSLVLPGGASPRCEPRSVLVAGIEWEGWRVRIVATHLGLGVAERDRQVEFLLEHPLAQEGVGGPVVLCGDLNLAPSAPAFARLARSLHDVQRAAPGFRARPTFPSLFPVRRIDHILVSSHFEILAARTPGHALLRRASDHLPLVADLRLAPGRTAGL